MSVAQIGNQLSEAFAEAATLRADPYGFDFCPAFWEWVELSNAAGRVFSIEKVGDEVQTVDDELSVWASARSDAVPSASTRKIKIPDACIGLGIKCMTPYEMLRRERARFVLGRSEAGSPNDAEELA